ncbi:MAG: hypothetical protein R3331_03975 [Sulfurospirillaceae bacterium]|nr:hypothetical protein [Sulfurospirillaceae bacterium]
MKKLIKLVLMISVLAFVFTGCRTSTLQNVNDSTFVPTNVKQVNLDNVARAIIRAGATLGWNMKREKEGEIIGTLYLRDHMAQVRIPYTTNKYSILYNDSTNLKYDAAQNIIHSNYNGWIQNLNKAIQIQLGLM